MSLRVRLILLWALSSLLVIFLFLLQDFLFSVGSVQWTTGLSLACSGSALCRLVFLHAAVLPDALAAGLHGDGDAFISTGERNCRVDIPNPVPSVNPVPGTDFFEFSCQTSCSLVFRETILSNFDNFEGLQLDRFLLTE